MIILDTKVLSELMRPQPAKNVLSWFSMQPHTTLFTTTITQAEILFGLALLPEGHKRSHLVAATKQMFEEEFIGRVLSFDAAAAKVFASITATKRQKGHPIASFDAQIAAIAQSRCAAIATRNIADFQACDVRIINPWTTL